MKISTFNTSVCETKPFCYLTSSAWIKCIAMNAIVIIEQTVVNLSSHVLTTSEMSLLQKGLACPTDTNFNQIPFTAELHQFY